MTVIATAGHVDHGKSSLVRHLTGTDPDRWQEEKDRGLTIDLGFASTELASGQTISFIDVPGHTKFLRNMISGVGAIDGCIFVVSAVEGWKPQSQEHLQILELLGIERGIIAITKSDLVDEELLELAKMEAEDYVAGTFLESAPIIGTSTVNTSPVDTSPVDAAAVNSSTTDARSGAGIAELKAELANLIPPPATETSNKPRLWIDRSFSPAGSGTVVTGTLTGGALTLGDLVHIVPAAKDARVRSLQNHHNTLDNISPGNRVAINLSGVDHHELRRGDCLIISGQWHMSSKVDAKLHVLENLTHHVDRRGSYFAYVGSAELSSKVQILGAQSLEPGSTGHIRLYFERKVPARPGDRFILRESGRNETIGGGQFVDVEPTLPTTKAQPDGSIERLVAERGWVDTDHLSLISGQPITPTLGRWRVDPEALRATEKTLRSKIAAAGELGYDLARLDDPERALVEVRDDLVVSETVVTIGQPVSDLSSHPWLNQLRSAGFSPPPADGIDRAELRQLVRQKLVIERDGIVFAATAVNDAAVLLAGAFKTRPHGVTVSEVRDLWSTSRKYTLALLGEMDETGVTRRREDVRIPGPRLPSIAN